MDARRRSGLGYGWTPEEDALLVSEWGKGFTTTQILGQFPGRTRNALIGRVNRLGLSRTKLPTTPVKVRRVTTPTRTNPFRVLTKPLVSDTVPTSEPPASEYDVPLLALRWYNCRSLVSLNGGPDGLATFCRERSIKGKSFCSKHAALYYVPLERRIRRRV